MATLTAGSLAPGTPLKFWSETGQKWVATQVRQKAPNGDVELECKVGHWVIVTEQPSRLRQINGNSVMPDAWAQARLLQAMGQPSPLDAGLAASQLSQSGIVTTPFATMPTPPGGAPPGGEAAWAAGTAAALGTAVSDTPPAKRLNSTSFGAAAAPSLEAATAITSMPGLSMGQPPLETLQGACGGTLPPHHHGAPSVHFMTASAVPQAVHQGGAHQYGPGTALYHGGADGLPTGKCEPISP